MDSLTKFWDSTWGRLGRIEKRLFKIGFSVAALSYIVAILFGSGFFFWTSVILGGGLSLALSYGFSTAPTHEGQLIDRRKEQLPIFREDILHHISTEIAQKQLPVPPAFLIDQMVAVAVEIDNSFDLDALSFPPDTPVITKQEKATHVHAIAFDAIATALCNFVSYLPKFESSALHQPLASAVDFSRLSYSLIEPFRHEDLQQLPSLQLIPLTFHQNVVRVSMQQNKGKGGELVYPQDYKGDPNDIAKEYFAGTPFLPLLDISVPLPLYDKTRFSSHHILGKRDSGKSTFLSHLLLHDIQRVPDISVVVMDSQFRLIDGFARLPDIDPILIGPKHPIAMNPFKWGNTDDVVDILTYAFGSVFEAEMTAHQTGPTEYIIRAVAQHPKANLDTLINFIISPDQNLIDQTDKNTQTYFRNFYKSIPANTRSGIVTRIMNLRKHAALDRMLNADGNDLDLPMELQKGRIIFVDTNKDDFTSDQTHVFGRLFIALMHNLMRKRIKENEQDNKPTFFYIDELADYCPRESDDVKFRELLDQARKQRLGLVVAHQRADQINSAVLKALEDSAIKTQYLSKGVAAMDIAGKKLTITVPPFNFPARITDTEYADRYQRIEPPPDPPVQQDNAPMSFDKP